MQFNNVIWKIVILTNLVSENHDAIVRFASNSSSQALSRVTHRIEGDEFVWTKVVLFTQVVQPGLENKSNK